ncbi:MAG: hypothetical protein HY841_02945 [Bacteroidetes bacterium]|nr:hypothetical protein [Bacteroidota bacterium]
MKTSFFLPMMFIAITQSVFAMAFADKLAENKIMSVENALKKNLVKAKIFGKGGHTGDVIKMKLKNNQNHPVAYSMEAGRRLDSENNSEQDILVTKAVTLALLPNETKIFDLYGMCCQAHNASPDSSSVFSIGEMADTNLVQLAKYIDLNKWYKNPIAQSAVWIVSDGNGMESIGGDDAVSKQLQKFVSNLTGKAIPKYKIDYEESNNGTAFYNHPAKISGTFEYEIYTNGLVTFGIYDAQGHVVEMFFTDVPRDKGFYLFNYEFKTSNLPQGDYYARLRFDGQVRKEQKFSF